MKWFIVLPFILCSLQLIAQQSIVRGIVSIHNSETNTGKRQFVVNAQVEDDLKEAQPTLTAANGQFILSFVGKPDKSAASLLVRKTPLQVVNEASLNAITGQSDWVRISMALPDSINEYRRKIYNVGKTQAEKQLEQQVAGKTAQLAKLRKSSVQDAAQIKQLEQQLFELKDKGKQIDEQAKELARKYAPVNLDDASPFFRNAFGLFQRGQLDSALLILGKVNLANLAYQILGERQKINNLQKELAQRDSIQQQRSGDVSEALRFKADLHATMFEFDSTMVCYQLLLQLDSTDDDNLFNYARFLGWLNQHDQSIYYYSRLLSIYKEKLPANPSYYEPLVANVQTNLGSVYMEKNDFSGAETSYQEALRLNIFNRSAEPLPELYESYLANLQTNLAGLYVNKNDFSKAEAAYLEALGHHKHLAQINPKLYERDLAVTQSNLGTLYANKNDFSKAEAMYLEAFSILKPLAQRDPRNYEIDLANTQHYLARLYNIKNDLPRAEENYLAALAIRKQIARTNPRAYEPDLALSLINLGSFYQKKKDSTSAQAAYLEAVGIYKRLAGANPQAYAPSLASALNRLGDMYLNKRQQQLPAAEAALLEAFGIYSRLYKTDPQVYEQEMASIYNSLAGLHAAKKEDQKAVTTYRESLTIYERLTKADPKAYEPSMATIQENLGIHYMELKNFRASEEACLASLSIFKRLAVEYPEVYELNLANTQTILGTLYIKMKKWQPAEKQLEDATLIMEKWLTIQPQIYLTTWGTSVVGLIELYATIEDTVSVETAKIPLFIKMGYWYDKLYKFHHKEEVLRDAYSNNRGSLAWYLLFTKQFKEAQTVALQGLQIDSKKIWIKTNIAHALLMQGKTEEALKVYQELKPLKDEEGEALKSMCLADLDKLEKAGITHKDINIVRAYLKKP
ncbi:tetratricopeptide repeat protein [Chitinophaga sp. SYP-B3965]|uniref:tetratricopeptide repeat protein n=1 Tax=Chitinophaga sp. SYP-B3965 TaxID=2663120 RepID=UPI0012997557|nr:tetratricopeptide repeat protein [Chitinophaga sp. SYP-B3965]MRG45416.1 tetratricopeptide repeat protein [Chitinophaga sp. SYP-B3965]